MLRCIAATTICCFVTLTASSCNSDSGSSTTGDADASSLSCGPGTHEESHVCIPDPVPDGGLLCGVGTHSENGYCVPDNPSSSDDPTPGICNSNASCSDGKICVYETGECQEQSPDLCGMPPDSQNGQRPLGYYCTADQPCLPGLVCVQIGHGLDATTGNYDFPEDIGGVCLESCDPCADESGTCVALASGGGFVPISGRLFNEKELCGFNGPATEVCEAGHECEKYHCTRLCVPDDSSLWDINGIWGFFGATESTDCPQDQVCHLNTLSIHGNVWTCENMELVSTGDACNDPARPFSICTLPETCRNTADAVQNVPGTCSPKDLSDCSQCPEGTNCRFASSADSPTIACVAPGSVGYQGFCEEDLDCAAPFSCKQDNRGKNKCLP